MGKRIVICADGTGNRGGVTRGTNVYRIANAVDIWGHVDTDHAPQVMFYQDGVGTDQAKFLKAIGGAFGYGLSANVRQLYDFLVRNYEDGDDIYLFGFSRGAYTVRALARMVTGCGLIDKRHYRTGEELDKLVRAAYKAHRRSQKAEPPEWKTEAQAQAPPVEGPAERFKKQYGREVKSNATRFPERGYGPQDVPIKLIGVWDTVGAVGLPFDELTDALDVFVGLKIQNFELHPLVEKGFQALAIDEERHTFHPVLWDETKRRPWQTIEQVWFAGVHSNVGGGYPKDQLAHVSLQWMMERAETEGGLRFVESTKIDYLAAANPNGRIYDSRSGFSVYYRYRPRNIRALSEGKLAAGEKPRVHASVFERLYRGTANYAPSALADYRVVGRRTYDHERFDPEREEPDRRSCLELARDVIWWRRCLYYAFLGVTFLFVFRLVTLERATVDCEVGWPFLGWIFGLAERVAPEFATGPIEALRNHPFYLFLYLLIGIGLLLLRRLFKGRSESLALAGWKCVLGEPWEKPKQRWWLRIARWMRKSPRVANFVFFFKRRFLPKVLAFGVPLLLVWGLWAYVRGALAEVPGRPVEEVCCPAVRPVTAGESAVIEGFDTRVPCFQTDVQLVAGQSYAFEVEVDEPGSWKDASHPAGPGGLTGEPSAVMKAFASFKRSKPEEYFTLMGGISCTDEQTFKIGEGVSGVTAEATGRLYLFVNDATCYWCPSGAWALYGNNQGKARVTVRGLGLGPAGGG